MSSTKKWVVGTVVAVVLCVAVALARFGGTHSPFINTPTNLSQTSAVATAISATSSIGSWGTITADPNNAAGALVLQEAGDGNAGAVLKPALFIDLSNINNTAAYKHGIDCVLSNANDTANENADCIALTTYHEFNAPAQGASEASALYAAEPAAVIRFRSTTFAEDAPAGLPKDYNDGRAIEVGVDGNKTGISINDWGTGGTGGG